MIIFNLDGTLGFNLGNAIRLILSSANKQHKENDLNKAILYLKEEIGRNTMGCDIHLYFEKKNEDNTWEAIEIDPRLIPDDRNYAVFGFLAGIRDDEVEPQFAGRGIPLDTSLPSKKNGDFYIGDFGFTYAYLDEILSAPWKENELDQCEFYAFCMHVLPKMVTSLPLSIEEERNVRVIMGFDN